MPSVFITGVSAGIGRALANEYLNLGWTVFGSSRRKPDDLATHPAFHFAKMDLADPETISSSLSTLLGNQDVLNLVLLNAGRLGEFGDLSKASMEDLNHTMQVNLWSNKTILDGLFARKMTVSQVVAVSSGAAVNGNRGWGGYSISKAALNMLTKLYATERPGTHFCALAPGVVDTDIQSELLSRAPDEKFPSVEKLRSMRGTSNMPQPEVAAKRLIEVISRLPTLVESGDYADIRQPPLVDQ